MKAAERTRSLVLTYEGKLCPVYFSACCAGSTRRVEQAIPAALPHPSLKGVNDTAPDGKPWCRNAGHFSWTRSIESSRLSDVLEQYAKARGMNDLAPPLSLLRREESEPLQIRHQKGLQPIRAEDFRMFAGRRGGWNLILSDRFRIHQDKQSTVFTGHGFGNRVGLCQAGALARIRAGQTVNKVLGAYFPGTKIMPLDEIKKE